MVPGVVARYVAHVDSKPSEKASRRAFDEMDTNCNTCKHLERVPFKSKPQAPIPGICKSKPIGHPYAVNGQEITFYPSDYMGMLCYEHR